MVIIWLTLIVGHNVINHVVDWNTTSTLKQKGNGQNRISWILAECSASKWQQTVSDILWQLWLQIILLNKYWNYISFPMQSQNCCMYFRCSEIILLNNILSANWFNQAAIHMKGWRFLMSTSLRFWLDAKCPNMESCLIQCSKAVVVSPKLGSIAAESMWSPYYVHCHQLLN